MRILKNTKLLLLAILAFTIFTNAYAENNSDLSSLEHSCYTWNYDDLPKCIDYLTKAKGNNTLKNQDICSIQSHIGQLYFYNGDYKNASIWLHKLLDGSNCDNYGNDGDYLGDIYYYGKQTKVNIDLATKYYHMSNTNHGADQLYEIRQDRAHSEFLFGTFSGIFSCVMLFLSIYEKKILARLKKPYRILIYLFYYTLLPFSAFYSCYELIASIGLLAASDFAHSWSIGVNNIN